MYEAWGLIPIPIRKSNGYRVFGDIHIDQFRLARLAFQIEMIQGGMRRLMIQIVKLSADRKYDQAIDLANTYIAVADAEIANAIEAAHITNSILKSPYHEAEANMKRKDVSDALGITMDTLRNWEMNGLINIKRKENGYRIYNQEDIKQLKIIRTLRCANYSLSSIKRMMNALYQGACTDLIQVLNTPTIDEDIISVCDKLITSLISAKDNASKIIDMLNEMSKKYK